jgi:hypothetical protein
MSEATTFNEDQSTGELTTINFKKGDKVIILNLDSKLDSIIEGKATLERATGDPLHWYVRFVHDPDYSILRRLNVAFLKMLHDHMRPGRPWAGDLW